MNHVYKSVIVAGALLFPFFSCNGPTAPAPVQPATGSLQITYQLNSSLDSNESGDFARAVWIEDANGAYIKTLKASRYLSTVGFNLQPGDKAYYCPRWLSKVTTADTINFGVDGITMATPDLGPNPGMDSVIASVANLKINPGNYRICVEVCVSDDESCSMLGVATLKIGSGAAEQTGAFVYEPPPVSTLGDVICDMKAKYIP